MLNYHEYTILIVEDSLTQALELQSILESRGFNVYVAHDGHQALDFLPQQKPDLIISDIVMPSMDGFELCSKIKAHHEWQQIPVLLLTALSEPEDVIRALECKADNFLTKPYSEQELISRLENIFLNRMLRQKSSSDMGMEIYFANKKHYINSDRMQIIDLLLSTYEIATRQYRELERVNKQLEQTKEKLSEAKLEAEQASQAKSDFLATMSHEIRTPMNAILGFSQLLQESRLDEEQKEYLETIHNSAQHLLNIINDILDFSKVEAGKLFLQPVKFRLRESLENILETFIPKAREQNIDLRCIISHQLPEIVYGDQKRLIQVVVNLLDNAFKFTEKGYVSIRVSPIFQQNRLEKIEFAIQDTGLGIAEDKIETLFQPFTQVDSSISRQFGGSGLGLAICRRIVELMQGQITVYSQPGEGSTFKFNVVLDVYEDSPGFLNGDKNKHPGNILLLGDKTLLAGIREILLYAGYSLTEVATVEEACQEISNSDQDPYAFSLVIIENKVMKVGDQDNGLINLSKSLAHDLPVWLVVPLQEKGVLPDQFAKAQVIHRPIKTSRLLDRLVNLRLGKSAKGREAPCSLLKNTETAGRQDSPLRVLVAEDDKANQLVLRRLLEKLGNSVQIAVNGQEAIQALQSEVYDLIFMDVEMPEMDGLEATKHIRQAKGPNRDKPIIAMTAHALQEFREKCLQAGMTDYVSKPVDKGHLQTVLEKWCP